MRDVGIVARSGFTWPAHLISDALVLVALPFGATPMMIIGIAGVINLTRLCQSAADDIESAKGGDRGNAATGGRSPVASRKAAADAPGISKRQRKTMQRVANVPEDEFEQMVPDGSSRNLPWLATFGESEPRRAIGFFQNALLAGFHLTWRLDRQQP